jgi:polyvinyl alcohol dehydrogenase (cytochrome)
MRYVCLFTFLATSLLRGQDGAAIYEQRCASCHNRPAAHVPPLDTIRAMSGEAIYEALTRGVMKTQATDLSTTELFALIRYIGPTGEAQPAAVNRPTRTCKSQPPFSTGPDTPGWNGWSTSINNSRFQDAAAAGLSAADLSAA